MTFAAMLLLGCGDNSGQGAEHLLRVATQQYEECRYDAALRSIDSLRRTFPTVVEARKEALRLQRNIELRLAQEELTVLDSVLQSVSREYSGLKAGVEAHKAALKATPDELTTLTKTRMRRDSVQTRHDVLCAKIRYLHEKLRDSEE
jgi:chromosome segregation ATPase